MSSKNGSVYVLYYNPLNYKGQLPYMENILGMMFLCDQKGDYGYALNLRAEEANLITHRHKQPRQGFRSNTNSTSKCI